MDTDDTWVQGTIFVLIWIIVYVLIGILFNEDLTGQAVQGTVGGLAFGLAYTYFQQRKEQA